MIYSYDDYTVGWVCALPKEMVAACGMLDEIHPPLPSLRGDHNSYTLGAIVGPIGKHNVVVVCLPAGIYGTVSAAKVTACMQSTFQSLRFGLMVGIGGGVPSRYADIRLGDVVVSQPTPRTGGVIQFDFGKTMQGGQFRRTGFLNKPPTVLLTAIARLQAEHGLRGHTLSSHIRHMWIKDPKTRTKFLHQGRKNDVLFKAEYDHRDRKKSCLECQCDTSQHVPRQPRQDRSPEIHYGLIASSNQVMRHGPTRDWLRDQEDGILCFEMEAAGLMDDFPCLVIRGICDYADTHKNKRWQEYAAAVAAAYARELLGVISPYDVDKSAKARYAAVEEHANLTKSCEKEILLQLEFPDMRLRHEEIQESFKGTYQWIFERQEFTAWLKAGHGTYWITGKPGCGKSTLMKFIYDNPSTYKILEQSTPPDLNLILAGFFFHESERSKTNPLLRSQRGLLRAILHQVLRKYPSLISSVVPDLWDRVHHYFETKRFPPAYEWSLGYLKQAVQNLFKQTLVNIRLCLVIDGLDEFDCQASEGKDIDLIQTLRSLLNEQKDHSIQVQLLTSSRPEMVFETAFDGDLHLRVHELTKPDIKNFVTAKLYEHSRTSQLDSTETFELKSIAENITNNSDGVFLWVDIVVRSVLEGLTNYDSIKSLKSRLKEFPSDLELLYKHLINGIDKRYHVRSVKIFRLLQCASTHITALLLSFALEDPICCINWESIPLTQSNIFKREFEIKAQLQSHCRGLVDYIVPASMQKDLLSPFYSKHQETHFVQFYHLTAKEFFEGDSMQGWLDDKPGVQNFDPHQHLLSAYFQYIHQVPLVYLEDFSILPGQNFHRQWKLEFIPGGLLGNFFHECKKAEKVAMDYGAFYLDAVDQVLSKRYPATKTIPHWSYYRYGAQGHDFVVLMLAYGLENYVVKRIRENKYNPQILGGIPLLLYAVSRDVLRPDLGLGVPWDLHVTPIFAKFLLADCGYDPNQTFVSKPYHRPRGRYSNDITTVWQSFLANLLLFAQGPSFPRAHDHISGQLANMQLLLRYGADVNANLEFVTTQDRTTNEYTFSISALSVFYILRNYSENWSTSDHWYNIHRLLKAKGASRLTCIKGPRGIIQLQQEEYSKLYQGLFVNNMDSNTYTKSIQQLEQLEGWVNNGSHHSFRRIQTNNPDSDGKLDNRLSPEKRFARHANKRQRHRHRSLRPLSRNSKSEPQKGYQGRHVNRITGLVNNIGVRTRPVNNPEGWTERDD